MKIGSSLALICVGAILAFAVTATPSFFNLHTAGWVLMLIGLIGLLIPGRTVGWLGRRVMVRRTYPSGRVEQTSVPAYVARNPGASVIQPGLPARPTLLDTDADLIEDPEPGYDVIQETAAPGYRPASASRPPAATEVVEDLYEQP